LGAPHAGLIVDALALAASPLYRVAAMSAWRSKFEAARQWLAKKLTPRISQRKCAA
jgi:hypothetical protein